MDLWSQRPRPSQENEEPCKWSPMDWPSVRHWKNTCYQMAFIFIFCGEGPNPCKSFMLVEEPGNRSKMLWESCPSYGSFHRFHNILLIIWLCSIPLWYAPLKRWRLQGTQRQHSFACQTQILSSFQPFSRYTSYHHDLYILFIYSYF